MNGDVLTQCTVYSRYRMDRDPAKWLDINSETGMIKTKHSLDRESPFAKDGKYRVLILAIEGGILNSTKEQGSFS